MDILDAIDAAVGCQDCGGPLDGSPSDDFCSDGCQQAWHAARADELVGYREPWDRPQDFPPGVIPPEAFADYAPPIPAAPLVASSLGLLQVTWGELEFRLPRSTGNLAADWRAARLALVTATTDEQRAAVRLRMESLKERQRAAHLEASMVLAEALQPVRAFFEGLSDAFRQTGEQLRPFFDGLRRAGLVDEPPPADPRERALVARRSRNTGPQQPRRRPPRSLGRPSVSGRR